MPGESGLLGRGEESLGNVPLADLRFRVEPHGDLAAF